MNSNSLQVTSLLKLYEFLTKREKETPKRAIELFNSIKEEYANLYVGLFKKDINALIKLNTNSENILNKQLPKEIENTRDDSVYFYIGNIFHSLYYINVSVLGIVL